MFPCLPRIQVVDSRNWAINIPVRSSSILWSHGPDVGADVFFLCIPMFCATASSYIWISWVVRINYWAEHPWCFRCLQIPSSTFLHTAPSEIKSRRDQNWDHPGTKQGMKQNNDIEQQGTARKHQRQGTSDTELLKSAVLVPLATIYSWDSIQCGWYQIYPNANTD